MALNHIKKLRFIWYHIMLIGHHIEYRAFFMSMHRIEAFIIGITDCRPQRPQWTTNSQYLAKINQN